MGIGRPQSRWIALSALGIALVGLGVGIGAWLRPMPQASSPASTAEPSFTEEQIAQAKAHVCDAYGLVKDAVVLNTHRTNPVPDDEIGALATGLYGPVAIYQGGDYLLDRLEAEPATPVDLANGVRSLGSAMKKLAMTDLTAEPDFVRDPLRQNAEAGSTTLDKLCQR